MQIRHILQIALVAFIGVAALGGGLWTIKSFRTELRSSVATNKVQIDDLRREVGVLRSLVSTGNQDRHSKPAALEQSSNEISIAIDEQTALLHTVKREIASLQAEWKELSSNSPNATSHSAVDRQKTEAEREHQEKEEALKREQQYQALDEHFRTEDVDNAWSHEATQQLQTAIDEFVLDIPESETTLHELECRSTLCVLDIEHRDMEGAYRFQMATLPRVVDLLSGARMKTSIDQHGRSRMTYYFVRSGEEFP